MKRIRPGDLVCIMSSSAITFVDDKNISQSSGRNMQSLFAMALDGRLSDPSKVLVWLVLRQARCVVNKDDIKKV